MDPDLGYPAEKEEKKVLDLWSESMSLARIVKYRGRSAL